MGYKLLIEPKVESIDIPRFVQLKSLIIDKIILTSENLKANIKESSDST